MRKIATVSRVLLWITLVLSVFFQTVAIIGIKLYETSYKTGPLAIATVLITLCVLLFFILRRGKLIPLIAAAVLGVCFIFLAASMHEFFGAPTGVTPSGEYMTGFEAVFKHGLRALLPVFMLPVWLQYRQDRIDNARREEEEPVESVLGGLADFKLSSIDEEKK
jgi:hypothetical protein